MKVEFRTFSELTSKQVHDILKLRQEVFIIEQNCIYPDIDGSDPQALHLLLYDDETLNGYLRIFEPTLKFKETTLGRIVVSPKYRGKEVGRKLIYSGIELAFQQFPGSNIRIEAQAALTSYYNHFGFKEQGDIYIVDDIEHIQMLLEKNI